MRRGGHQDQLHEFVLIDDLPRRGGEILADPERRGIGHLDFEPAFATFEIGQQIVQPFDQVFPAAFDSCAKNLRVRQNKIAGRHRVDELSRIEIHFLSGFVVEALDVADGRLQPPGAE